MDAKNTITDEELRVGGGGSRAKKARDIISGEYSASDSEDDDGDPPMVAARAGFAFARAAVAVAPAPAPAPGRCRECDAAREDDGYICGDDVHHLSCSACSELVPDRRTDDGIHQVPPFVHFC